MKPESIILTTITLLLAYQVFRMIRAWYYRVKYPNRKPLIERV